AVLAGLQPAVRRASSGGQAPPPGKSDTSLVMRIRDRIAEQGANPFLAASGQPCGEVPCLGGVAKDCLSVMACSLLQASRSTSVPLPILVAQTKKESHFWPAGSNEDTFGVPYLQEKLEGVEGCPNPWPVVRVGRGGSRQKGWPIGPLQTKPAAFCQVGMKASDLYDVPIGERIRLSILAGAKYMAWLKNKRLPGRSWADCLHAYNVGPGAFENGSRNHDYVNEILADAARYTELA
ncbi:transglycosylase SLT domain-containing protein, partial [Calidithermus chliarophilus]|uniref:transglycosylase SLT domain-containing protein n=1 Tax=Calidithermus chliarophilus TaxID=52023 RepID=UPI0006873C25